MPSNNDVQQSVHSHIKEVTGHSSLAVVPRIYTYFTDNPLTSMLLSQIVFWSGVKSSAKDGYFWKSIPQWQEELGLKYNQVVVGIKKLEELGIIVTCLRPIGHRLTTHYKLNKSRLIELIDQAAKEHYVTKASEIVITQEDFENLEETETTENQEPKDTKQPVASNSNAITCEGDDLTREVVLTPDYALNNAREEKESLLTLASLAYTGAQPKTADAPVALVTFAPTMQADLSFVNPAATQPTFLDLPQISESTSESKTPLANPTKEIAIRNKPGGIHPPKLPGQDAPKRKTKPKDPLLESPAIKKYFFVSRYSIRACARQMVVDTVGSDPKSIALWEDVIRKWIMRGYNPRNIDGMLEAFRAGGLKPNGYKKADPGIPGMTPRTAASNPNDPDGYVQNHTPKDVWDKTGGDTGLCIAYVNIKVNPGMRNQDWAIKAIAGLREKGVEI